MNYITIKDFSQDDKGLLIPQAHLWRKDDTLKYSEPDIKKIMTGRGSENMKLVEIEIKEIKEIILDDIPKY